MSPVTDLTEGNRVNNHLKGRTLLSPQVENGCEGAWSYCNSKSAQSLGTSRDSLKSKDAKSTFYPDFKLRSNTAHSSDYEATRNRFATEDVRVSSPLSGHRPPLIENNHASVTSVSDASVQVQSDGLVRPNCFHELSHWMLRLRHKYWKLQRIHIVGWWASHMIITLLLVHCLLRFPAKL